MNKNANTVAELMSTIFESWGLVPIENIAPQKCPMW